MLTPNKHLKQLDSFFDRQSSFKLLLFTLILISFLAFIDYYLGPEISFSVFYLIPIMVSSWYGGLKYGLLLSFIASGTWLSIDLIGNNVYSNLFIPVWNSGIRLLFFLTITYLLWLNREFLLHEEHKADTDELTGLFNRRAFYEHLDIEIQRSKRYQRLFTLAYFDLDNFKEVNDTLGHHKGDEVLVSIATTLKTKTRCIDIKSRIGGDEFVALFPETDQKQAEVFLTELWKELNKTMKEAGYNVTCTLGAITFKKIENSNREFIKYVDDLMYEAKRTGKNKILFKTHE